MSDDIEELKKKREYYESKYEDSVGNLISRCVFMNIAVIFTAIVVVIFPQAEDYLYTVIFCGAGILTASLALFLYYRSKDSEYFIKYIDAVRAKGEVITNL